MVSFSKTPKSCLVALILSISTAVGACSTDRWWGESKPPASVVKNASSGGGCMNFREVFRTSEKESKAILDCWFEKVDGLWSDVRGSKKEELQDSEVKRLIDDGVLSITGDRKEDYLKVLAVKRLVGMKGPISRKVVKEWFDWLESHRNSVREFYIHSRDENEKVSYEQFMGFLHVAASFLRKVDWQMESLELSRVLKRAIKFENRDLRNALPSALRAFYNGYSSICPTFTDHLRLRTSELADCIDQMNDHFKPGKHWVEFILNPASKAAKPDEIVNAAERLYKKVNEWFSNEKLRFLEFQYSFDFASDLGALPPPDIFQSMVWINNFATESDEKKLHPLAYRRVFEVFKEYVTLLVNGQGYYVTALKEGRCNFPRSIKPWEKRKWQDCILQDYNEVRKKSSSIDLALRARNEDPNFSYLDMTGGEFATTMLIHAAAQQLIIAFGDTELEDGQRLVVVRDLFGDSDEAAEMLTQMPKFGDRVSTFFSNIFLKLRGKEAIPAGSLETFANFDIDGLLRLVTAVGSDILVQRNEEESFFLEKILIDEVRRVFPLGTIGLDRIAITGVVSLVNSLPSYRNKYLAAILASGVENERREGRLYLNRQQMMDAVPGLLETYFPRTFYACKATHRRGDVPGNTIGLGFRRTCGLAFDEIIPRPDAEDRMIQASNLDLVTLISIGLESLVDTCDTNKDGQLGRGAGTDELTCVTERSVEVTKRLIEANIIKDKDWIKTLLSLTNWTFLTRHLYKGPLTRGDFRGVPIVTDALPHRWGRRGTLGTLYGMIAFLTDTDRAKALGKERKWYLEHEAEVPATMPRDLDPKILKIPVHLRPHY